MLLIDVLRFIFTHKSQISSDCAFARTKAKLLKYLCVTCLVVKSKATEWRIMGNLLYVVYLSLLVDIPRERNSVVGNLLDVPNRVEALLVIRYEKIKQTQ